MFSFDDVLYLQLIQLDQAVISFTSSHMKHFLEGYLGILESTISAVCLLYPKSVEKLFLLGLSHVHHSANLD